MLFSIFAVIVLPSNFTLMRMGQEIGACLHKKILSLWLLGQDANTTCGATRLDASSAQLIAYYHTQLFVYGGVTPSHLLFAEFLWRKRVSVCPQEPIPIYGTYRNPTACGSLEESFWNLLTLLQRFNESIAHKVSRVNGFPKFFSVFLKKCSPGKHYIYICL